MSSVVVAVGLVLAVAVAVAAVYAVARSRSRGLEPGRPDRVSEDVVSGLMSELRKWQAEAAHWKSTAERLQRRLEERQ
jgi:hypothetical protein